MKRNGKIELMRFLFSIGVLVFHINQQLWSYKKTIAPGVSLCKRGNMGVEFFFLVSGFLMAKSIAGRIRREGSLTNSDTLGTETLQFLWRKAKGILPYHVPYCLLMLALLWQTHADDRMELVRRLPSFFLFNRTGLMGDSSNLLGVEWYLSAMFLAMAVLYPLLRRHYDLMARLVCPVAALLILGWMQKTYGYLTTSTQWDGLTFHCNLRAIAELSLGVTCYEVSTALQKRSFTTPQRLLFSVAEALCYGLTFRYICSLLEASYEVSVVLLLTVAVTLSFSQVGLLAKTPLFQNQVCVFLGGVSLPIYLIQQLFQDGIRFYCPDLPNRDKAIWMFVLTVGFGALSYVVVTLVNRLRTIERPHPKHH